MHWFRHPLDWAGGERQSRRTFPGCGGRLIVAESIEHCNTELEVRVVTYLSSDIVTFFPLGGIAQLLQATADLFRSPVTTCLLFDVV